MHHLHPGADPGFSFRGAQKIMFPHALYERGTELTSAGVQGQGCFNALSCYLSLIFKHSDFFLMDLKNIVDPILGGGAVAPPLDPPLYTPPRISTATIICAHDIMNVKIDIKFILKHVVAEWIKLWTLNREVPVSNPCMSR